MGFFSKLFGSKKRVAVDTQTTSPMWKGCNMVERVRDDGYVIYKSNRVTREEREQVGFYGTKWYSENGKYCAVYLPHDDDPFNLALVDVPSGAILFKSKLQRPHRCRVTNTGILICDDWGSHDARTCYLYVIGKDGKKLYEKRHNSMLGDTFELTENETVFVYELNYSHKKFTVGLQF